MHKSGFFLLALALLGCSKSDSTTPPSENTYTASSYYPLSVGNYWVYDLYEVDTNGVEAFIDTDSMYIEKDTILRGNRYFVKRTSRLNGVSIIRDSSDYLINRYGLRLFGPQDKSDTLDLLALPFNGADTTQLIHFQMNLQSRKVSLPAGNFNVLELIESVRFLSGSSTIRPYSLYRAPNVGIVYSEGSYSHNNPIRIEYRLRRYFVR
jgi:hypothetical protein